MTETKDTGRVLVGLYEPQQVYNIRSVVRNMSGFGAHELWIQYRRDGATEGEEARLNGVLDAMVVGDEEGAVDIDPDMKPVQGEVVRDILDVAPIASNLVAVEFTPDATPLADFNHPDFAYYIFGPEDGSLPHELIYKDCPERVFIPSQIALNLASAVSLVLYDRALKRGELAG